MYSPDIREEGLFIPSWCYEDTPIEDAIETEGGYLSKMPYEDYRKLRRRSYYACRWYPYLIKENIPVIDSILVNLKDLDIKEPQFVRTCGSSPKDLGTCIFSSTEEARYALAHSTRTQETFQQGHEHILARDVISIVIECRCFIHQRKLRAVSIYCYLEEEELQEFKDMILEFFELYEDKLPYNSSVIEICTSKEYDFPTIVEFNSFGVDQYSGASLFDWDRDRNILYYAKEPIFRMPDEFEWT